MTLFSKNLYYTASETLLNFQKFNELLYIVEFQNSNGVCGYGAYPAYRRIDEPICFVERGSIRDTTLISPLAMFFKGIDSFLSNRVVELEDANEVVTKSLPDLPGDGTIVDSYEVVDFDELLRIVPVEWGQGAPLGAWINDNRGICSVVAVAQAMSYHRRPFDDSINQNDWTSMINGTANSLVSHLGLTLYNDLYYDLIITEAAPLPSRVVSVFNQNGYTADDHNGYSSSDVRSYLVDGPVVLLGFHHNAITHPGSGHYWLADGCRTTTITTINVYEKEWRGEIIRYENTGDVYVHRLFHYNWGWYGSSNGWYNAGVFQPNNSSNSYSHNMNMIHVANN